MGNIFNYYNKKFDTKFIKEFFFSRIRFLILKKSSLIITNGKRDTKLLINKHQKDKIFEIPYAINVKKYKLRKRKKIVIGIPGSIDPLKKDYLKILKLIGKLNELKKNIKVYFIGHFQSNTSTYTKQKENYYFLKFKKELNKLKKDGFDIVLFKKKLSQKLYQKCVKECDIMYAHLNFRTYKPSEGNAWTSAYTEGITYNKIILTNRKNSPKDIDAIELKYTTDEEFYKIIRFIINNKHSISQKLNHNIGKYFGRYKYRAILNKRISKI